MKKILLKAMSVILAIFMLMSVVTMVVSAANSPEANIIKEISVSGVHTPYAGYRPDYGSRLGSTSYTYDDQMEDDPDVYNGKWWYDETEQKAVSPSDTFKLGHVYTFNVLLVPTEGYEFWVDNYNTPFIKATVNGEEAVVYDDLTGKYQALVEYTFDPCDYNYEISTVEVNVKEPVVGGYPSFDAEILTAGVSKDEIDSPFCIESVAWYDCVNQTFLDPSHTFKEDGIYEVNVFLTTIGDYYFSTENDMTDVKVIINGKEGEADTAGKDDSYHIRVSCVVFGDIREEVPSVEITDVTKPSAGETADFDLSPANDSFYINGVYWTDITDSNNKVTLKETDTFEAGHEYRLDVWIRANEKYKFLTDEDGYIDIDAVIDGKAAEVSSSGTEIAAELSVTYSIPAATVVSFVDVTNVDAPVAGETPDTDAFCETQGCNVSKVEWYDVTEGRGVLMGEGETFTEGRVYRVVVTVDAEGNHVYLTVDGYNEATGDINGETAIVYGSHDEKVLELGYEFAPCEAGPTDSTEPSTGGEDKPTDSTEPSTGGEDKPTDSTEPSTGGEDKPTTPDSIGLLGDANCDGKVNIKDATEIQKHIAGLVTLSETGLILADVDSNIAVNIKDATAIQKYLAGMVTGFAIGEEV